jgi:hypothetical protein
MRLDFRYGIRSFAASSSACRYAIARRRRPDERLASAFSPPRSGNPSRGLIRNGRNFRLVMDLQPACAAIHFSTTGAMRSRHLLPLKMP